MIKLSRKILEWHPDKLCKKLKICGWICRTVRSSDSILIRLVVAHNSHKNEKIEYVSMKNNVFFKKYSICTSCSIRIEKYHPEFRDFSSKLKSNKLMLTQNFGMVFKTKLKVRQSRNDFFKPTFPPKNEKNKFYFTTMKPQVDLFSFIFWRKLKTPKRHFEINWPLKVIFINREKNAMALLFLISIRITE